PVPLAPELMAAGAPPPADLLAFRRFIGTPQIGYKVAICERDLAIYGSVLLAGLVFAAVRGRLRPPSIKLYLILLIPIAVDGLSQMVGLRESNWWLRTLTGAIFGVASVWLGSPYVERASQDVLAPDPPRRSERRAQPPAG